jgi:hypothetical protein
MPHRPLRETMLDPTTNDHWPNNYYTITPHRPLCETMLGPTIKPSIY